MPDGRKAAVCYSTGIVGYERGADWYLEGGLAFTLHTHCPAEEGDMETLSNWPIGPIPGLMICQGDFGDASRAPGRVETH